MPTKDIDHINGDKADNRICNLREASYSVNSQNRQKANANSKSGLLGAYWQPAYGCWVAMLGISGKRKTLGRYPTAEQAHEAYLTAKRQHHAGCTI